MSSLCLIGRRQHNGRAERKIHSHADALLGRPTALQAIPDRRHRHTGFARPIGQRLRAARSGDEPHITPVASLLTVGRPTAVFRRVVAVVVDAVDRERSAPSEAAQTFRPRSHVGEEVLERLPPRAHPDPAPAVVSVRVVSRVLATPPHVEPHAVFGRVRRSVPESASAARFVAKAPARLSATIGQVLRENRTHVPAVALAPPRPTCRCNDEQPTESSSL
jgi:hypothetical protein